jgi:hypothetical protein
MAAKASKDKFANIAAISCVESAANTLTYKKLETGIAIFDKVAWLICRLEYYPSEMNATQFNSSNDGLNVALCAGNTLSDLAGGRMQSDPLIIHGLNITRQDIGTAASGLFLVKPLVYDFSTLPGSGILIPPTSVYLGVQGSGLAAATTCYLRIFYTLVELAVEDYWELVESRRMISS